MKTLTEIDGGMFGRVVEGGNIAVFNQDGSAATRINARVWPVGSDLSGAYEHPNGIVLTAQDAANINLAIEA